MSSCSSRFRKDHRRPQHRVTDTGPPSPLPASALRRRLCSVAFPAVRLPLFESPNMAPPTVVLFCRWGGEIMFDGRNVEYSGGNIEPLTLEPHMTFNDLMNEVHASIGSNPMHVQLNIKMRLESVSGVQVLPVSKDKHLSVLRSVVSMRGIPTDLYVEMMPLCTQNSIPVEQQPTNVASSNTEPLQMPSLNIPSAEYDDNFNMPFNSHIASPVYGRTLGTMLDQPGPSTSNTVMSSPMQLHSYYPMQEHVQVSPSEPFVNVENIVNNELSVFDVYDDANDEDGPDRSFQTSPRVESSFHKFVPSVEDAAEAGSPSKALDFMNPQSNYGHQQKKQAFQMSAHEDYLELDDDVHANGVVSTSMVKVVEGHELSKSPAAISNNPQSEPNSAGNPQAPEIKPSTISSGSNKESLVDGFAASNSTPIMFGATSSSSAASISTPIMFGANSSSSPANIGVFSFGAGSSAPSVFSVPSAAASTPAPSTPFSFQPAFASSTPQPFGLTHPAGNNDRMSMEDSMADDSVQVSTPAAPVFGQPISAPSSSFVFNGAAQSAGNPFQFSGQQNQFTPQSTQFQPSGSLEFNAGGAGIFSLGSGGVDKASRRIVKVKKQKRRK